MNNAPDNHSEVARLLSQIRAEYEAAQMGLTGLTYGTSKHSFITARMETMGSLHTDLRTLVGDDATKLMAEQLEAIPDIQKQDMP